MSIKLVHRQTPKLEAAKNLLLYYIPCSKYTFGLFHGMQQIDHDYSVKPIVKQLCHVDLWATDLR